MDGVKLSVLDAGREVALRRRLPAGVRLYTGDDFGYAELIRGDASGHSDALLGAFAAITAPAAAALAALDRGDLAGIRRGDGADGPAQPGDLRAADVRLQGRGGLPGLAERSPAVFCDAGRAAAAPARRHLIRVFELAAAARALTDPELAVGRMNSLLATLAGAERV